MGVAEAGAAADRHQQPLSLLCEVAQQDACAHVAHLRAAGHLDGEVITAGAGALVRSAAPALLGLEQALVLEVEQGLQVGVCLQPHIAAAAAIAAGGAAGRHVLLPAEGHDAVATAAGPYRNAGLINELHLTNPRIGPPRDLVLAEVRFQQVSKTYPPRRGSAPVEVLRQLDLAIEDGEFLVLVGPSGCGKSTLLRLLAGLEAPSSGEVYVGDRCVTRLRPAQRDVAMVFQSYALYPHLSVADNIGFGLRRQRRRTPLQQLGDGLHRASRRLPAPLRLPSGREVRIEQRIAEVAETLELSHLLDRLPKELSGGQKQRVALGRAIARQPAVFLMDEPLSNLDAKLRTGTRAQIVELQRRLGTTTVYVTHDQVEAMTMGHRIAVLNRGALQQLGTPLELYQWPSNLFVAQFIGSPPMNLLPVTSIGGGQLQLGGHRFLPEGPMAEALLHWQSRGGSEQLSGGLRAEHLKLAPATNRNLPAEVSHREALGNEQLLTCRLLEGDHLVQLRAAPEQAVAVGQTVHLEVDPAGWRLFDANGEALRHSPAAASVPMPPQLPALG